MVVASFFLICLELRFITIDYRFTNSWASLMDWRGFHSPHRLPVSYFSFYSHASWNPITGTATSTTSNPNLTNFPVLLPTPVKCGRIKTQVSNANEQNGIMLSHIII